MTEDAEIQNRLPEDIQAAIVVERVINGEEVTERIGNCGINNAGRSRLVRFDYYIDETSMEPAATFVFDIEREEGLTKFINTHRIVHDEQRRRQGIGTQALTSLEHILTLVVRRTGCPIDLDFHVWRSHSTQQFLEKFNYQPTGQSPTVWHKKIS